MSEYIDFMNSFDDYYLAEKRLTPLIVESFSVEFVESKYLGRMRASNNAATAVNIDALLPVDAK